MTADRTPALTRTEKIALTDFQNDPGPYLDRGRRAPVTITKHGHPDLTIDDAAYFERIERDRSWLFSTCRPSSPPT